jgi:hypothetical protein
MGYRLIVERGVPAGDHTAFLVRNGVPILSHAIHHLSDAAYVGRDTADVRDDGIAMRKYIQLMRVVFGGMRWVVWQGIRGAASGHGGGVRVDSSKRWRGEIERELTEMGGKLPDTFDMCSMIWFTITDEDVDQTPAGKVSNLLVGSARQIEDILKRYQEAGMTMPLLWPPFRDVPTSKTLDDLKRLAEEILPKVSAV